MVFGLPYFLNQIYWVIDGKLMPLIGQQTDTHLASVGGMMKGSPLEVVKGIDISSTVTRTGVCVCVCGGLYEDVSYE